MPGYRRNIWRITFPEALSFREGFAILRDGQTQGTAPTAFFGYNHSSGENGQPGGGYTRGG
jgi:hypothetical protein